MASESAAPDVFQLFDLRVEVVCPPGKRIMCGAKEGDHFTLKGEMLYLPPDQGISIYSLGASSCQNSTDCSTVSMIPAASVLPLLAAKKRVTHDNDWMTSDALIACPDPCCPSQLKIMREGARTFRRSETTAVPLTGNASS